MTHHLLDYLGHELSKPVNPDSPKLGGVLTDEHGTRYLVVTMWPIDTRTKGPFTAFGLVKIPGGMTAIDHGRKFRHEPLPNEPTRAVLI